MPSLAKRPNPWPFPLAVLGGTTALALACIFAFRPRPFTGTTPGPAQRVERDPTPALGATASSLPLSTPASAWPPEEIFRRAFWRQPTAQDDILHAERRESSLATAATGATASDIQSWRWFLALHPGPDLLRSLRDPDTFGLAPTLTPRPWAGPAPDPIPAWFPSAARAPEFEILQAPAGRLTLLYRAKDNTLFATDTGAGFAPAVQRPR